MPLEEVGREVGLFVCLRLNESSPRPLLQFEVMPVVSTGV